MPKLKQPGPLQKLALNALFEFVVDYCDQLSVEGSEDELRHGIFTIKEHIYPDIPWHLLADFTSRFLDKFCSEERPTSHYEVAAEILMDMDIPGLRCEGRIAAYLGSVDVQRFRRLEKLDLCCLRYNQPIRLHNFHLEHLTTLIFLRQCTDSDLRFIGRNCLRLRTLNVQCSSITDEGLRSLSQCSELRFIDIFACFPVSPIGIHDLLSANKRIEEFTNSYWDLDRCDFLSYSDSLVCPSMRRFIGSSDSAIDLETIHAMFPNLTYINIRGRIHRNLSSLKSFSKLAELSIHCSNWFGSGDIEEAWRSLNEVLTFLGANITSLEISHSHECYFWLQDNLDFVFNTCPNIEHLGFDKGEDVFLVIPPFQKLKKLELRVSAYATGISVFDDERLKISKLPNLEILSISGLQINFQNTKSIILDDVKFPSLAVIEIDPMEFDHSQIERIARTNNLDVKIKPGFHTSIADYMGPPDYGVPLELM